MLDEPKANDWINSNNRFENATPDEPRFTAILSIEQPSMKSLYNDLEAAPASLFYTNTVTASRAVIVE